MMVMSLYGVSLFLKGDKIPRNTDYLYGRNGTAFLPSLPDFFLSLPFHGWIGAGPKYYKAIS